MFSGAIGEFLCQCSKATMAETYKVLLSFISSQKIKTKMGINKTMSCVKKRLFQNAKKSKNVYTEYQFSV